MRKLLLTSLLLCTGSAFAQAGSGYVTDSSGNIVRSGFNLCVQTGHWTPANAVVGCDLVKPQALVVTDKTSTPIITPGPLVVRHPAPLTDARQPESIVIPASVLFAFDKSVLTQEGKNALRDILAKHPAATVDTVIVIGHTDRFGSDLYNQKLSERRAQAVADFIVAAGVDKALVKAVGHGEKEPVTNGACTSKSVHGMRACYAPDRRVEVSITSTPGR